RLGLNPSRFCRSFALLVVHAHARMTALALLFHGLAIPTVMRSHLPGFLSLLFIWHLGPCPCGCPEHNAWMELCAGHDETERAESSSGFLAGPALQRPAGRCVGQGSPPYIRSGSESGSRS